MVSFKPQPLSSDIATLHYRPNDRQCHTVVVTPRDTPVASATHLPISIMSDRSEADLNTWLRYAIRGTAVVLHLTGKERIDCARRVAWFVETCRRFDIDLDLEADAATRDALELLHALGAEMLRFDDTLARDWRGRVVIRRLRSFARDLCMAA